MCGIAGFVFCDPSRAVNLEQSKRLLTQMTDTLTHRGPDGSGVWACDEAGLGHRRLSIIDLAGGAQPMQDARGRAVITFNGEIYNYPELKNELEAKGHVFSTRSDTEVLLAGYLEYGTGVLDKLEGMFAFAIWDRAEKTLFAARDRFGKKPFFYTLQKGIFAFASELAALTRMPLFHFTVERRTLARFLAYDFVPTPYSIYREAHKLRPGHYLLLKDGKPLVRPYWRIPVPEERASVSEAELKHRLRELLEQAVKRRLISDVPLGVFLSGGIDSSGVAATMAGLTSQVKTFSIGFKEASYDESGYAKLVASRIGAEHHETILDASSCGELLPGIVARQDEPLADPSIVPTYLLSRETRRHVTVALGGDGPDELFAGYEHYLGFNIAETYLKLPEFFRRNIFEPVCAHLPMSSGYINPRFIMANFIAGANGPRWLRAQRWMTACSPKMQLKIWQNPDKDFLRPEKLFSLTRGLYDNFPARQPLAKVFNYFLRQYMLDDILTKVDRCSMMHSLEVRAPYLDRDFAEFVCRLPLNFKLRGFTRKYLLKKALADVLPREILHRPKRGFLIPAADWLRQQLKPLVDELLGEDWLRQQGLFNPLEVKRMVDEHTSKRADHRRALWNMLVLQLWLRQRRPSLA